MTGRRRAALLGWGLLAFVVPAFLALVEVLWLPLRAGPVLLPVSVVAAVVGNALLVTLAARVSGSRVVGVLPAVAWLAVVLRASVPRPEGDLLLVGGGTLGVLTLVFLGLGLVSAMAAVGRMLGTAARGRRPAAGPPAVRARTGSGSGGAR
jgi:hypothetical protein